MIQANSSAITISRTIHCTHLNGTKMASNSTGNTQINFSKFVYFYLKIVIDIFQICTTWLPTNSIPQNEWHPCGRKCSFSMICLCALLNVSKCFASLISWLPIGKNRQGFLFTFLQLFFLLHTFFHLTISSTRQILEMVYFLQSHYYWLLTLRWNWLTVKHP